MDEADFPMLVRLQRDVKIGHMPFREDDQLIFNEPNEVPFDVPFMILQRQCTPRIVHFFEQQDAKPTPIPN